MVNPTNGDCVWIEVNATIVGKITIGDDVLMLLTLLLIVMFLRIVLSMGIRV